MRWQGVGEGYIDLGTSYEAPSMVAVNSESKTATPRTSAMCSSSLFQAPR